MKKYTLLQYLFIFNFIFLFQCNKNSGSIVDNNECFSIVCEENLSDFRLKVSVSMTPYDNQNFEVILDSENYFGVYSDATDGYDSDYDILESPNEPGNWISLYFPHVEWDHPLGNNFTQDIIGNTFLNQDNRIMEWQFNVESSAYGTINLDFKMLDDYCYDCINTIQLIANDDVYTANDMNFNNINISSFLQQNQILSFNLIIDFNQ